MQTDKFATINNVKKKQFKRFLVSKNQIIEKTNSNTINSLSCILGLATLLADVYHNKR
jgi:CRISPR/Cas system CSM-associated protein Csm2 small subunit